MLEQKWTPKMVAERFEDAANTLRRLPRVCPKGYGSSWPPIVQELVEACTDGEEYHRLGPPSGDAITRMDECLEWMRWLEPEQTRIIWLRAIRVPWKLIMQRYGRARSIVTAKWTAAIMQIVAVLNAGKMSRTFLFQDISDKI